MELQQEFNNVSINKIINSAIDMLKYGVAVSDNTTTIPVLDNISHIEREIFMCKACGLHKVRLHAVPGEGVKNPLLLIVGEAPSVHEDQDGRPFVGQSGQYLDKWLEAIGLSRHVNVYITNIVKCMPPQDRMPHEDEIISCNKYLTSQINVLKPKVILALGKIAGNILTNNVEAKINDMRQQEHIIEGIPLCVTFHPSAVLKNLEQLKPLVWEDLKKIKELITLQESSVEGYTRA